MKLHLGKFIHTIQGKYLMSVLLGFGFATFFRAVCHGSDCIIRVAPPLDAMKSDKIYSFNQYCYSFQKKNISCPLNADLVVTI